MTREYRVDCARSGDGARAGQVSLTAVYTRGIPAIWVFRVCTGQATLHLDLAPSAGENEVKCAARGAARGAP